jgi:uncharacterized protein (TIGR02246 family)
MLARVSAHGRSERNDAEQEIRGLYARVHEGWNSQSGEAFAAPFADDGLTIGFDGSVHSTREGIASELSAIFADHEVARYIGIVKSVRLIGNGAGVLRAVAGLVPPGKSRIRPETNAHQTLIAEHVDGRWRVVLFQNTPAQFHGRPELADALTQELQHELDRAPQP